MTVVTKDLKKRYEEEVKTALKDKFGYDNVHQIPKLSKIVINMGSGEFASNSKLLEKIHGQLTKIVGQKAVVTKAKNQLHPSKSEKVCL